MRSPLVLVIDEHEDSRIIVRTIAQYDGFEVLEAPHGRRGLELAVEHGPDVIVVDLDLRRLPATDVVCRLRSVPSLRDVPLIALASADTAHDAITRDCDAVVLKPLAMTALLGALRRLSAPLDA